MLNIDIGGDVTEDGGVDGPLILVNTVNCVGTMGKGVALAMAEKFPQTVKPYKDMCARGTVYPGSCRTLWLGHNRWMALLATKDHYRESSRYEWVATGLVLLAAQADGLAQETGRPVTVRLPPAGCGLGGLEWPVVSRITRAVLGANPRVQVQLCLSPEQAGQFRLDRPGPIVAGIGARKTPPWAQAVMADFGEICARHGWQVRSGGAIGADQAFGNGFARVAQPSARARFTAWLHEKPRGNPPVGAHLVPIPPALYAIAKALHPDPRKLGLGEEIHRRMAPPGAGGQLMARNGFQFLGDEMTDLTDLVVCWTEDGREKGGTGQALRLAGLLGIPVINLGDPANRGLDAEGIRARALEMIGARERFLRAPPPFLQSEPEDSPAP